jgi:hypothetical protein
MTVWVKIEKRLPQITSSIADGPSDTVALFFKKYFGFSLSV